MTFFNQSNSTLKVIFNISQWVEWNNFFLPIAAFLLQVSFMKQMRVEQLFVEGKYMVIYLSPETAVYDELGYYLWNKDGNGELSTSVI